MVLLLFVFDNICFSFFAAVGMGGVGQQAGSNLGLLGLGYYGRR